MMHYAYLLTIVAFVAYLGWQMLAAQGMCRPAEHQHAKLQDVAVEWHVQQDAFVKAQVIMPATRL